MTYKKFRNNIREPDKLWRGYSSPTPRVPFLHYLPRITPEAVHVDRDPV